MPAIRFMVGCLKAIMLMLTNSPGRARSDRGWRALVSLRQSPRNHSCDTTAKDDLVCSHHHALSSGRSYALSTSGRRSVSCLAQTTLLTTFAEITALGFA